MKLMLYNDKYKTQWDEFVEAQNDGTFHHLIGWKEVFEEVFKYKSYYLMALDEKKCLCGVLPLLKTKDVWGKKYLISTPFTNYAGICAPNDIAEKKLIERSIELCNELNVQYLQIKQLDKEFENFKGTNNFVTMFIELSRSPKDVWKTSLKAKTRNQVRKSEKYGLKQVFSKDYVNEFYSIYAINMRRLGTPVLPRKLFYKLLEVFPENTNILTVWQDDTAIAGMFIFKYKKIMSDPWASSLWEYKKLCPNNLMYWQAIKHGCENGLEIFDMGRSTIDSGTFNFKKQWGAKPTKLKYQYYLNKAKEIPMVNAFNNKYEFAIKIWKKLPLGMANTLGPRLVKYLPEL